MKNLLHLLGDRGYLTIASAPNAPNTAAMMAAITFNTVAIFSCFSFFIVSFIKLISI